MTDQTLREALEAIGRGAVPIGTSPAEYARKALAAHPAEPALGEEVQLLRELRAAFNEMAIGDPGDDGSDASVPWADLVKVQDIDDRLDALAAESSQDDDMTAEEFDRRLAEVTPVDVTVNLGRTYTRTIPAEPVPEHDCTASRWAGCPACKATVAPVGVEITDDAVEAAGKAVQRVMGGSIDLTGGPAYVQFGRAALEAALPHLTLPPVASRERVEQVVRRVYLDGGASIPVAQEGAADIVAALLAAGVFRDEAVVKAEIGDRVIAAVRTAFSGDEYEENARGAAQEDEWSWFRWLAEQTVAAALRSGGQS